MTDKAESMTVEEFVSWLYSSPYHEPCDEDIKAQLRALVYGESVRAAGCAEIVAQLSEVDGGPASDRRRQGHEIARRFRSYAKDILATSPGREGA